MSDAPFRRFSRASQCDGKRAYSRKAYAKAAARAQERSTGRMHPYRCHWCGQWHLGHSPKIRQAQRPA